MDEREQKTNMKVIHTKEQALKYLFDHIPDGKIYMYPGQLGVERVKYYLKDLANPKTN